MKHTIPELFENEEFLKSEIKVKWNEESTVYFLFKVKNNKLIENLHKINHKAIMGLTAALSEWIFWRINEVYPAEETLITTDAIWLGLIDKRYIVNSRFGGDSGDDIYDNILWIVYNCLEQVRFHYTSGSYRIVYRVINLAMLTRYITPNKAIFDSWLSDCLNRLTTSFPIQYDSNDVLNHPENYPAFYDSSHEPPIPREFFFETDFDYATENIDELLTRFMNTVDHSNPACFKTEQVMIAEGFKGRPYIYPQETV
ncbi:hypothetical protein HCA06_14425 [Listeria welshimeri]|nr:hypothetical protein [Listeria welshimeri]